MPFVLDASVTACWALADENDQAADVALDLIRSDEAVVPAIWWFEVRNFLIVAERRKRIAEADTAAFLREILQFAIRVDRAPDEAQVLQLCRTYRLSVYDAVYLELARRDGVPLATLDADLAKAAKTEGVSIVGKTR